MKYIFDLRDYNTRAITEDKLCFLAPEMYREIKLNMNDDVNYLVVERYYEVSYGEHMTLKISSEDERSTRPLRFNDLCNRYINTMITPWQLGTKNESQGCKMTEEIWLVPDMEYKITMEELVDIFGLEKEESNNE